MATRKAPAEAGVSLAVSRGVKQLATRKAPTEAGAFVVAGACYDSMHQMIEKLLVKRLSLPRNGRHSGIPVER